jgi:hypothetical protein
MCVRVFVRLRLQTNYIVESAYATYALVYGYGPLFVDGEQQVDAFRVLVHAVHHGFGHLETTRHAHGIRDEIPLADQVSPSVFGGRKFSDPVSCLNVSIISKHFACDCRYPAACICAAIVSKTFSCRIRSLRAFS